MPIVINHRCRCPVTLARETGLARSHCCVSCPAKGKDEAVKKVVAGNIAHLPAHTIAQLLIKLQRITSQN